MLTFFFLHLYAQKKVIINKQQTINIQKKNWNLYRVGKSLQAHPEAIKHCTLRKKLVLTIG